MSNPTLSRSAETSAARKTAAEAHIHQRFVADEYVDQNSAAVWAGVQLTPQDSRVEYILMRAVVIHPGEDGYWVAACPSLPGCISQGVTQDEAIKNIKEAIEGYILALQDDGLPVPEEKFQPIVVTV